VAPPNEWRNAKITNVSFSIIALEPNRKHLSAVLSNKSVNTVLCALTIAVPKYDLAAQELIATCGRFALDALPKRGHELKSV
jgi:hypothetical protein